MIPWLFSLLRSFRHAYNGIAWALRSQRNLRIHATATFLAVTLGFIQNIAEWEWCCLSLCIGLVWTAELVNTAIEITCDRVTQEHDDSVRRAKDVAAGAVLVTAILAAFIGLKIFL